MAMGNNLTLKDVNKTELKEPSTLGDIEEFEFFYNHEGSFCMMLEDEDRFMNFSNGEVEQGEENDAITPAIVEISHHAKRQ